jgi:DNA-binding NtrC family response regulator
MDLILSADGMVEQVLPEPADLQVTEPPVLHTLRLDLPLKEARKCFERAYLRVQLERCGGKVGRLSKVCGMERTHLYRVLRGLGVTYPRIHNREDSEG